MTTIFLSAKEIVELTEPASKRANPSPIWTQLGVGPVPDELPEGPLKGGT